jgi:Domain of unknown function (DUF4382)/Carboxypeptidase regulatory-like domain
MKIRNNFLIAVGLLLTIAIFIVSGCDSSNEPQDSGSLLVKVTDAPFPADFVKSATVTIDSIEIRQKSWTEDNPYIVISNVPMDFDLLELRNGITASLPEIEIPVGSYDLVRLYVESANIVLKGGLGEFNLKVPSGDQTGIKIFIDPEIQIQGGLTAELLIDFDLSKSFIVQGSPDAINGFHFKPTLRAVNNSLAGSIYGVASDANGPLVGVEVTVRLGEENASAITDENGYYEILGLKAGAYTVSAILDGYVGGDFFGVGVTANNKIEQNFVLVAN